MAKHLIVNLGSDSKKYSLFENGEEVSHVHFEVESTRQYATLDGEEKAISSVEYENSHIYFLEYLKKTGKVNAFEDIVAVAFRIVAPGTYFTEHRVIDSDFKSKILLASTVAPLHLASLIKEIEKWGNVISGVKMFGVSDSAFHKNMLELSKIYAISQDIARQFDVYRFGYHGISVASVINQIREMGSSVPERIIVCHLGSGASIVALKKGETLDTSMGFTPLEGLPMNSRTGDIDAGAVVYLQEKLGFNSEQIKEFLNHKSGLLAVGGIEKGGVRELIELKEKGNKQADLALNLFAYKVKKYVGSYVAVLGGLDLLVFTATIGERSAIMRKLICDGLDVLGISLDQTKNEAITNSAGEIGSGVVNVLVVKTDEAKEMEKELSKLA